MLTSHSLVFRSSTPSQASIFPPKNNNSVQEKITELPDGELKDTAQDRYCPFDNVERMMTGLGVLLSSSTRIQSSDKKVIEDALTNCKTAIQSAKKVYEDSKTHDEVLAACGACCHALETLNELQTAVAKFGKALPNDRIRGTVEAVAFALLGIATGALLFIADGASVLLKKSLRQSARGLEMVDAANAALRKRVDKCAAYGVDLIERHGATADEGIHITAKAAMDDLMDRVDSAWQVDWNYVNWDEEKILALSNRLAEFRKRHENRELSHPQTEFSKFTNA